MSEEEIEKPYMIIEFIGTGGAIRVHVAPTVTLPMIFSALKQMDVLYTNEYLAKSLQAQMESTQNKLSVPENKIIVPGRDNG